MHHTPPQPDPATPRDLAREVPFSSNDVRLSPSEWIAAAIVLVGLMYLIPAAWERIEPLHVGPDYRVPYSLGNDYWNYARTCRQVATGDKTLLVGDSVVWGHYVGRGATLSHYLNEQAGEDRFANLGLDGVHPAALCGLVEDYGTAISGKEVILNCNLLWISSPRHDLSADKEFPFNHPALVPQFSPAIPCYRATLSERLGTLVSRRAGFLGWAEHVRILYFEGNDLATWTIDHPYNNPAAQVTLRLPSPDELPSPTPDPRPWTVKGIGQQSPEWVALNDSLQWRLFRRTVELLRDRGNQVFVLVGPYNEHMLTPEGLRAYTERKDQVAAWLVEQKIPHYVPRPLPSRCYADASHPTAEGYRLLARWLFKQEAFTAFRSGGEPK